LTNTGKYSSFTANLARSISTFPLFCGPYPYSVDDRAAWWLSALRFFGFLCLILIQLNTS